MNLVDVVGPLVLIAVIVGFLIAVYVRQGRNHVLEEIVEHGKISPIESFRGTLAVEENRPNFFLRLRKNSEGRRLQFLYRWLIGMRAFSVADTISPCRTADCLWGVHWC
jgi:hypothetical protein